LTKTHENSHHENYKSKLTVIQDNENNRLLKNINLGLTDRHRCTAVQSVTAVGSLHPMTINRTQGSAQQPSQFAAETTRKKTFEQFVNDEKQSVLELRSNSVTAIFVTRLEVTRHN